MSREAGTLGAESTRRLVDFAMDPGRAGFVALRSGASAARLAFVPGRDPQSTVALLVQQITPLLRKGAVECEWDELPAAQLIPLSPQTAEAHHLADARLLIFDPDEQRARFLVSSLEHHGAQALSLSRASEGLGSARALGPEILLVRQDILSDGLFALFTRVRRDPVLRWASIVWMPGGAQVSGEHLAHPVAWLREPTLALISAARAQEPLPLSLDHLGPARTLSALMSALGEGELHVRSPRAEVQIAFRENILLGATGQDPQGARFEGSAALAALLALDAGELTIAEKSVPSNLMMPLHDAIVMAIGVPSPIASQSVPRWPHPSPTPSALDALEARVQELVAAMILLPLEDAPLPSAGVNSLPAGPSSSEITQVSSAPPRSGTLLGLQVPVIKGGAKPSAPQIPAPKVPAPKIPAPKVPAPKVPAPKIPALKIPAPKVPAPKIPAPKIESTAHNIPESADLEGTPTDVFADAKTVDLKPPSLDATAVAPPPVAPAALSPLTAAPATSDPPLALFASHPDDDFEPIPAPQPLVPSAPSVPAAPAARPTEETIKISESYELDVGKVESLDALNAKIAAAKSASESHALFVDENAATAVLGEGSPLVPVPTLVMSPKERAARTTGPHTASPKAPMTPEAKRDRMIKIGVGAVVSITLLSALALFLSGDPEPPSSFVAQPTAIPATTAALPEEEAPPEPPGDVEAPEGSPAPPEEATLEAEAILQAEPLVDPLPDDVPFRPSREGARPGASRLLQLIQAGNFHRRAGRLEMAHLRFGQALAIRGDNSRALAGAAAVAADQERYSSAILHAQKLVEVGTNEANNRVFLAGILQRSGDIEGARAQYNQVLALEPRNRDARRGLAALERSR